MNLRRCRLDLRGPISAKPYPSINTSANPTIPPLGIRAIWRQWGACAGSSSSPAAGAQVLEQGCVQEAIFQRLNAIGNLNIYSLPFLKRRECTGRREVFCVWIWSTGHQLCPTEHSGLPKISTDYVVNISFSALHYRFAEFCSLPILMWLALLFVICGERFFAIFSGS